MLIVRALVAIQAPPEPIVLLGPPVADAAARVLDAALPR